MDYRDLMQFAPNGMVTIVDNETEYSQELGNLAKKLGKSVGELTEAERDDAWETFKASHGLCDLDFLIP